MSAPYSLGENAKIYYSATALAVTPATAPATVAANVKDVKVSAKHDTPEYTTRANGGKKQYAVSLTDLSVTFMILVPPVGGTDAAYTAFRTAWKTKVEIQVFALTGASGTANSEGPAGNFVVSDFSISEGNGEVLFATVELKPSSFNDWFVDAGA